LALSFGGFGATSWYVQPAATIAARTAAVELEFLPPLESAKTPPMIAATTTTATTQAHAGTANPRRAGDASRRRGACTGRGGRGVCDFFFCAIAAPP
jgi:hypothetical protein